MNDDQLLRYSRQIMLPQIDAQGQEKLLNATALIIGLGGLGAPVSMYLAAAGVGHLILVDFDKVELTNLQRQIVHTTDDIDRPKVESARDNLHLLNPEIKITTINKKLDDNELLEQIKQVDIVIEGSDNFATRFAVNAACVQTKTPLVSGAAIRMEGQVSVYLNDGEGPCYHCLYKDEGELDATCSENGVLAPVVGIIGSIQATEALKVLTNTGEPLSGRLLLLDAMSMEWRTLKLKKDPGCPVCSV
ncbi:MAG: molybdopterin-synthase adenylyltransferase MoeB [Gammaproteobacteria bacterium]|nr:molybdopterin-synthase adenylyltransferase MoeB [Gammaproteobacteria bacterium]